ncbi:MAG: hypothetical protein ACFCBW_06715 [Candidatus Competibacterales bacterium]
MAATGLEAHGQSPCDGEAPVGTLEVVEGRVEVQRRGGKCLASHGRWGAALPR